jgi:hypothetical protein
MNLDKLNTNTKEMTSNMSKNAYEIRLDILSIAYQYENSLFSERLNNLKTANTPLSAAEVQKLYPSRENVLKTAEMFYAFVSDNSRNSKY